MFSRRTMELAHKLAAKRMRGPFESEWHTRREMWSYWLISMTLSTAGLAILLRYFGLRFITGLILYVSGKCFWIFVQCKNKQ